MCLRSIPAPERRYFFLAVFFLAVFFFAVFFFAAAFFAFLAMLPSLV